MVYTGSDEDWPFPDMKRPTLMYQIRSHFFIPLVGTFTKVFHGCFIKSKIYNSEAFFNAYRSGESAPLVTVSNHVSCMDDPLLWGFLKWSEVCSFRRLRWTLAAHDICFTNSILSMFFSSGKCIPVIRGNGVFQRGMNFCLEQLSGGSWVHIFPEGKVNMDKEYLRLKWGVGRLIYECPTTPVVVPFYHVGMDDVLPNRTPYVPRIFKKVTILFGKPIDFKRLVSELRAKEADAATARKAITDVIQKELFDLRKKAEHLHKLRFERS